MDFTAIVEALIFASPEPVSSTALARCLRQTGDSDDGSAVARPDGSAATPRAIDDAVVQLNQAYQEQGRAFRIVAEAGGWRFLSHPDFAPWIARLLPEQRPARLSPAALETLAIIAYRQPITKSGIEEIRGVGIDGVLQTVLDRGLVRPVGRATVPGRPVLYGTTGLFLEHFGIPDLDCLPHAAGLRGTPGNATPDPPCLPAEPGKNGDQLVFAAFPRPAETSGPRTPEKLSPVAAARKLAESQVKQPAASPS